MIEKVKEKIVFFWVPAQKQKNPRERGLKVTKNTCFFFKCKKCRAKLFSFQGLVGKSCNDNMENVSKRFSN